jgi:hypothetical protein
MQVLLQERGEKEKQKSAVEIAFLNERARYEQEKLQLCAEVETKLAVKKAEMRQIQENEARRKPKLIMVLVTIRR